MLKLKKQSTRLLSLDVFRGITIAVMILVNSPGAPLAYSWLSHSQWDGCTLADLVFPFFIVILGISSSLTLANSKIKGCSKQTLITNICKRSLYLFAIGLLLNAFPYHFHFYDIRVLGVLQRIAICYFFSSILFLTTSIKQQIAIIAILLLGYWLLMHYFSSVFPLTMEHNLVGYLDNLLFSPHHLYTPQFDPEGLLSTLPAIASALLGNVLGYYLVSSDNKNKQLRFMILAGLFLAAIGWLWSFEFPLNKSLWSSAYVLWTGGLAYLVFAFCFALIEIKAITYWCKPFALFGRHAMLLYVMHIVCLKIQAMIKISQPKGELISLKLYITNTLFGHLNLQNASLCYALSYTLFWLLVLLALKRLLFNIIPSPR